MFRNEINPYTVSCKAVFRNIDKTLVLYVRSDAPSLMAGLKNSAERLSKVSGKSSIEEQTEAARYFARTVFGEDGDRLVEFYHEPQAVIAAVGMFFDRQLKKAITKAQKK